MVVRWWDAAAERYRLAIGYVGEDGIEPGVAYRWSAADGRLVPVEAQPVDAARAAETETKP